MTSAPNTRAFPGLHRNAWGEVETKAEGMSLREYYVGQAVAGLAAKQGLYAKPEQFAERVVKLADAVIAELADGGEHHGDAVAEERERCARIVEAGLGRTNTSIAKLIREGGE